MKRAPKNTPLLFGLADVAATTPPPVVTSAAKPIGAGVTDDEAIATARRHLERAGAPSTDDCAASVNGDTVTFFRLPGFTAMLTYTGTGHTASWRDVGALQWTTVDLPFESAAKPVVTAPQEEPPVASSSEDDRFHIDAARNHLTSVGAVSMHQYAGWIVGDTVWFNRIGEDGGGLNAWLSYDDSGPARGAWLVFAPLAHGGSTAEWSTWARDDLAAPPVDVFKSKKGRVFEVGDGVHERINTGDAAGHDTYPIFYGKQPAGSLFRTNSYGRTAGGSLRWHASVDALRWSPAVELPHGEGYDVASFDSAAECLEAWAVSADQIIDAQEAKAQQDRADGIVEPVCPRCLGVEPGKPGGTPDDAHPGPFTDELCGACASATKSALMERLSMPASEPRRGEFGGFNIDMARAKLVSLGAEIVNGCVGWVDGQSVSFAEKMHGVVLASVVYDEQGWSSASWIVRLPNGSIRNDSAKREDHEDPATIAGEIVTELRGALGEMEKLTEELSGKKGRPTLTLSVTSSLVAYFVTENPAASPVRIVDALDEFLKRHPVSYDELYDVAQRAGLPPKAETEPFVDRLTEALGRANERAEHDLRRLEELNAEISGVTVEEMAASRAETKRSLAAAGKKLKAQRPSTRARRGAAHMSPPPPVSPVSEEQALAAAARLEASLRDGGAPPVVDDAAPVDPVDTWETTADGTVASSSKVAMRKLTPRQQELLSQVAVVDDRAIFTSDDHVEDWDALKSTMTAIGGTWRKGSKKAKGGFVFAEGTDVAEVVRLAQATGEVLDPRLVGFVPTPDPIADLLVDWIDPQDGDLVLEPEAGSGNIVRAIHRTNDKAKVTCYELLETNRTKLAELAEDADGEVKILGGDFLKADPEKSTAFDSCAMNPPFENRADIIHVRHAIRFVKPGGKLAAIVSGGAMFRDDKLGREFRSFVASHGTIEALPDGSFASEGTGVRTAIVRITACPSCALLPENHSKSTL